MGGLEMQKICAAYIRVSTHDQEEYSPESQIKLIRDYARKNGMMLPEEYIFRDDGISGRTAEKRPDFMRMIATAKQKPRPFESILVWKFSRFARNQEESIVYKSMLKKDRVEVISISEPITEGPFGSLIERIIEWMDEYYSIRLSGEVRRGMTQNALRGHYQSNAPIGYLSPGNRQPPCIDPNTCAIPLKAKDLFLYENYTPRQIACYLNEHGYRTKNGNPFDTRGIRYLLENPFYCGIARWNKTPGKGDPKTGEDVIYAKGNWEALWDEATYRCLKEKLDARRNSGKTRDVSIVKHWLSGSVMCSSCGRTLCSCGTAPKKAFQCWGYTKGLCRVSHYIRASLLEKQILVGLEKILFPYNQKYEMKTGKCTDHAVSNAQTAKQIDFLNEQLKKLEKKENRLKEAYVNEIDTLSEYKEGKKILRKERSLLMDNMNALTQPDCSGNDAEAVIMEIAKASDLIALFQNNHLDNAQKAAAFRTIVDSVRYDKETATLSFYLCLYV